MNKKLITVLTGTLVIIVAVFVLISVMSAETTVPKSVPKSDKLQVSTSFYPLYFFANQIGGNKVEVNNIVPAGAEPHNYEPTAKDMVKIQNSELIIFNGAGFEGWAKSVKQNIDSAKTVIVMAGDGLGNGSRPEETDPHFWLDPVLAQKMVDSILEGFVVVDPENAEFYNTNALDLKNRLKSLDEEYKKALSDCLQSSIITSHNAFSYLADSYGFEQVSIAGLTHEAEPSLKQLAEISKFAKENNIKYIFFENLVSPRLAQVLATEVGAQTLVLNPIEGVSESQANQGKDYFSIMKENLINLQTALQCKK